MFFNSSDTMYMQAESGRDSVALLLCALSHFRMQEDSEKLANGTTLCAGSPVKPSAKKTDEVLKGEGEEDSGKPDGRDAEKGDSKQVGSFTSDLLFNHTEF